MLYYLLEAICAAIVLLTVAVVWAALRISGVISQEESAQDRYQMMTDYVEETGDDENPSGR